ncbi:MAG: O-antigen ligase family protein [Bacteroidota bacterium]
MPAHSPGPLPPRASRLASCVLQVGLLSAIVVVGFQRSFDLDRFFVPKELVLHATAALAGALVLVRVRRVSFTWVDLAVLGFLVASALSAALATNPWVAGRALALSLSGATVFWATRALHDDGLADRLLGTAAVAVVLAAVTALLQAYGLTSAFFATERAPGGTLANRNFVGHLAAFGLPLLLLPALRARRWTTVLQCIAGVVLVVGILVLTRSRAAWLAAAAVLAVLTLGLLLAPALRRWALVGRLVLVLAAVAGGGALATLLPNALDWRSDTPYLETAQGVLNYREGSGRGRLLQYQRSLALVRAAPVLGVGPGNWAVAYPGVAPAGDPSLSGSQAGMTSNPWPSSDAVALVSERGVLGAVLGVLFAGGLLLTAVRTLRRDHDATAAARAVLLLSMGTGLAVAGAFDAVLLLAWPVLLAATVAGATFSDSHASHVAVPRWLKVTTVALLVVLSGVSTVRSAGQWAAMQAYEADESRAALERAAAGDPGNYRLHLRLAQRTRGADRCPYALAAAGLFPHAEAAQRLAARCE